MENLNSVCYVGVIGEIRPIEGADNIELTIVNGWHAITKKGEYEVGNKVVIATTDAVIPVELSDLMEVTNYLRKGQRVRTVKLRGVYSECLLIPFKYLEPKSLVNNVSEGHDMMGILGVTKYEPPVKMVEMSVGGRKFKYHQNPNFHVYHKFPNMKNVPDMFNENDEVCITRKLHGTNARYGIVRKKKLSFLDKIRGWFGNQWIQYEYVLGSHNVEKGSDSQGFYDTNVWKTIEEKYDIRKKLWRHVKNVYSPDGIGSGFIIYGEIYGHGIQKNYDYGLEDIRFAGFDVEVDGQYEDNLSQTIHFRCLELDEVETLYTGPWGKEVQDSFVFNNFIEGTKVPHEGVVVKSTDGSRQKIAKVINPDYHIFAEKNNVGDSH
jgi:RNA ligase (TIGR02306 family)